MVITSFFCETTFGSIHRFPILDLIGPRLPDWTDTLRRNVKTLFCCCPLLPRIAHYYFNIFFLTVAFFFSNDADIICGFKVFACMSVPKKKGILVAQIVAFTKIRRIIFLIFCFLLASEYDQIAP
jgi:hypothetical protein